MMRKGHTMLNNTTESTPRQSTAHTEWPAENRFRWRVIDIVVAAVLGVLIGLIFLLWNIAVGVPWKAIDSAVPGAAGILNGGWLMGGVLGGIIIRKPGAALFVELVASFVEMALGGQWGIETIYSGIAQGLGAEIVFAIFVYRTWGVVSAMLAGAGSAVGLFVLSLLMGGLAMSFAYNAIYLVSSVISGIVLGGILAWVLARALAATGALDRFAIGRSRTREV